MSLTTFLCKIKAKQLQMLARTDGRTEEGRTDINRKNLSIY